MFRTLKTFVLACSGVGLVANVALDAQACGGRGGGGGYRSAPAYPRQQYCPTNYQRPQAPPQQFPQAGYQQLNPSGQYAAQGQIQGGQFQGSQVPSQPQPRQFQSTQLRGTQIQGGQTQGQFVQGQQVQGQGQQLQGQPLQGQQVQGGQPQTTPVSTGVASAPSASHSALSALGGDVSQQPIQQQPIQQQQQQPVQQQPQQQIQQQQIQQPQQQIQQGAPQQSAPVDSQQPQSPEVSTPNNAENDALQALLGPGVAQPPVAGQQEATSAPQASGQFRASVSGGATVELSLNADGTFQWVALSGQGKRVSFAGSYSIQNGSLTLQRTDNQKLEGTMTFSETGFNLQLAGQSQNGLAFVRG